MNHQNEVMHTFLKYSSISLQSWNKSVKSFAQSTDMELIAPYNKNLDLLVKMRH